MRAAITLGIAGLIWGWVAGAQAARAAKPAKPAISGLKAAPSTVASGGATFLDATVSGAEECVLASSLHKPVAGLPVHFSCESGSVKRRVAMPANAGTKAAVYKLTLTAIGPGGKATAHAAVTVSPAAEAPPPTGLVATGGFHTCGVKSSGRVECWGDGSYGELGNESEASSDSGVEVHDLSEAVQVGAGDLDACALLASAHVVCWGAGVYGQLGDGGTNNSGGIPVEVQGVEDATQIATGAEHSCALLATRRVRCWGRADSGQLGRETGLFSDVPLEVPGITEATQVSAGLADTCALLADGHIECWGLNTVGQLGSGSKSERSYTPEEVKGIENAVEISVGGATVCALLATKHVDCWGWNKYGQLGNDTNVDNGTPGEVHELGNVAQVSAGYDSTCALLEPGDLMCWGSNGYGQLGSGSTAEYVYLPTRVKTIETGAEAAAGEDAACALLTNLHVDCWGANGSGQLGNGTTVSSNEPVEALGMP